MVIWAIFTTKNVYYLFHNDNSKGGKRRKKDHLLRLKHASICSGNMLGGRNKKIRNVECPGRKKSNRFLVSRFGTPELLINN